MLRTIVDRPPQKSRSVTIALVTLQRPPPLTRILAPSFFAPSRTATERTGLSRRVKIPAARPAAPPPTITISKSIVLTDTIFRHADVLGALDRSRAVVGRPGRDADPRDDATNTSSTVRNLRRIGGVPAV